MTTVRSYTGDQTTIDALLGRGAKVIVMSNFGRPKGKVVRAMIPERDLSRFLIGKVDVLVVAGAMANTFLLRKTERLAARCASATWLITWARLLFWRISETAL